MLSVVESRDTGLVTVSLEWVDAEVAASWLMLLVSRLNEGLREQALQEAEGNVQYLREELAQTNIVTLQQSIARLLEAELQKLMLARGNEEFAFRIVDAAEVPKRPSRPRRVLIVAIGLLLGGAIGIFTVILRHMASKRG